MCLKHAFIFAIRRINRVVVIIVAATLDYLYTSNDNS